MKINLWNNKFLTFSLNRNHILLQIEGEWSLAFTNIMTIYSLEIGVSTVYILWLVWGRFPLKNRKGDKNITWAKILKQLQQLGVAMATEGREDARKRHYLWGQPGCQFLFNVDIFSSRSIANPKLAWFSKIFPPLKAQKLNTGSYECS